MSIWAEFGRAACFALMIAPLAAGAQASAVAPGLADRMTGDLSPVHDPAMIKDGDTYYVFSTSQANEPPGLIHVRTSKDMVTWTRAGAVFRAIPDWAKREVPGTKGVWAPDISFSNGQYRLYYSISTFGSNHSAIGLATTPTLDPAKPGFGWTDQGPVIVSSRRNDFNAIDPAAFTDRDGKQWLAFGSFWTGLKLIRLDPATGKRLAGDDTVHPLARRARPGAVEAPSLLEHGGYYYLFAAHDFCCRGAASTYYTVVGRAKAVTGPYVDYDGKPLMDGSGQVLLHAQIDKSGRWKGPGGGSVLRDGARDYFVYHAYDAKNKGVPTLRIAPLGWTADGWPVARQ
ncbi:arabinan endo-1,5-alpha-L-arabinosidase [Sphingomonas sp.]|jgi:arabinan endo-1,5-alpha-L-arabinosidase|uniref:arabinan endo-1,5-alpha-L-arabinosidase n=1 Tax=Sphingomonas sp. TaxID=28214 RepID=UPI002ED93B0E